MTLKKSIILPIAGQDFSIPSTYLNDQYSFGKNCLMDDGFMTQREGHEEYSATAMSSAILEYGKFQKSDLNLLMTRFSATKSEVYNSGADTWDDITKSATDWTTLTGTNFYDTAVHIDTLMITNGKDDVQKYIGSGLCADLGGTPPKGSYIETVGEYVVLADITDGGTRYPWRVQWCDTGDIEDWSTGNAGFADLLDNDQKILGIKKLNENLVVLKEKCIYIGRLVDSTDVFNFDLIESGQELLNNRCIVEYRGKIYYLSIDGNIYAFNGYSSSPVGDKIQDEIGRVLNTEKLGMSFGRVNRYRKCIEFFICQSGYAYCNFRWALNYETGAIFYDTFDTGVTCATTFKDTTGQVAYDDLADSVTYDNITRFYDEDLGGTGFEFKLIGKEDGKSYKENADILNDAGVAIPQDFITPDFNLGDHERLNRWSKMVNQLMGTSVTAYYSVDFGATYFEIPYTSSQSSFTLTNTFSSYTFWKDLKSQYIRFKFSNVELDSYFAIRQLAIYGTLAAEVWK